MYFPPVLPHGGSAESAQECAKNTGFCIHEPMLHDFCKLLKLRQARGAAASVGVRRKLAHPLTGHTTNRINSPPAKIDQVDSLHIASNDVRSSAEQKEQNPTGGGSVAFPFGKPL